MFISVKYETIVFKDILCHYGFLQSGNNSNFSQITTYHCFLISTNKYNVLCLGVYVCVLLCVFVFFSITGRSTTTAELNYDALLFPLGRNTSVYQTLREYWFSGRVFLYI